MDEAFLRTVAALQANLSLLESQQGALSEFQDMQALRRLRSELTDYIECHAEKGELPADPLATVALRLEALKTFFREAESATKRLLEWKDEWLKGIPHVNLESLQQATTELAENEKQLPNMQRSLRGMLDPRDWDESGSQPILHHELRICGQTMHRLAPPSAKSCAALHGFAHGTGKGHEQVWNHLGKIRTRITELMRLHDDHLSKVAETEQHLAKENFRSAEKVMETIINNRFSDINYFKIESDLKKQIAFFERFKSFTCEINPRLHKGDLKAARTEIKSLNIQNLNFLPDSELKHETLSLLTEIDDHIALFLKKRKKRIVVISAILTCCLSAALLYHLVDRLIETEAKILSHPPGAKVILDGKSIGETPVTIQNIRSFSEWQVLLQKEGYETLALRGKTGWRSQHNINIHQLQAQPQKVIVTTEPSGANVISNGKTLGTTPWESTPMTIGTEAHYQLNLPGYIRTEAKGKISFGRHLELRVKLNQGEFEAQNFSFDYRLKLAKEGGAYAQALVGHKLYFGPTEGMDEVQIAERKSNGKAWIEKSAEQLHPLGLAIKGRLKSLERGRKDNPDELKAETTHQYEKAVRNGLLGKADNTDQTWWLYVGFAYFTGYGVTENAAEAVKWFRKAAEQGDATAQYNLGCCYANGEGVAKDPAEAVKWFLMGAEQGDTGSQCGLGWCYDNGAGVPKDSAEAVKWFLKAAEQGDATAQYNLGCCYANGAGVPKDSAEALKWFRKAAEQGNINAQNELARFYSSGMSENLEEAAKWLRKAAEQDDAKAKGNLGLCYANGEGVTKDPVEAVKWFREGAEQGDAGSQCGLGWCYDNGYGVAKNVEEGFKWTQKAAEQNYATAQYNLGCNYSSGKAVAKDQAEALKWFRKAAEQGHAIAQRRLGVCYCKGEGVAKDHAEAVKWLRKAAEQDNASAQDNLGRCYYLGNGVAKDQVEAVKWFQKAAQQGASEAQYSLGRCYLYGEGVAKDQAESVKWFRMAAEEGLAIAQYALAKCYANGEGVAKDHAEEVKWLDMAAKQGDEKAKKRLRELGIR